MAEQTLFKAQRKFILYKTWAEPGPRKGKTVKCQYCHQPYTDYIAEGTEDVTCAKCIMGLADGLERIE